MRKKVATDARLLQQQDDLCLSSIGKFPRIPWWAGSGTGAAAVSQSFQGGDMGAEGGVFPAERTACVLTTPQERC